MKGDKKGEKEKGPVEHFLRRDKTDKRTNKAVEFFYELSLRSDFSEDIRSLRVAFGMPVEGSGKVKKGTISRCSLFDYLEREFSLMEKYGIPPQYEVPFAEYISSGLFETNTKQLELVGFVDRYAYQGNKDRDYSEEYYIAMKEPFVKIILFGHSSKADVHDFIDKSCGTIETVLMEQGAEFGQRVKKKTFKKRDGLIIELSKKPNDELKKIVGSKYTGLNTKEGLIQNIMSKEEYGEYKVSDGYVKKLIHKHKQKVT
ncbi:MAG: hypothetical protein NT098_06020 [Candidatus Parcubacteria bacterium]|nr:hypothetical protein [Candidatus Parcubacteria bacterium]